MRRKESEQASGSPQVREVEVLLALARYRYLTTSQIERLLYPSRRVANRRMGVLVNHGLVHRFRSFTVPGHGSNEFVYHLSSAGAAEAAEAMEKESVPYPKPRGRTPTGMKHTLGIIQTWLSLDLACEKKGIEVVEFWPEWEGTREGKAFRSKVSDETPDLLDGGRRVAFRPDAGFVLGRGEKRSLFFLEVDWQSEPVRGRRKDSIEEKLMAYASYRKHGGFQRYGEMFSGFRVLSTWTSESRMHHAREVAWEMGLRALFLFAPYAAIEPETVLGEIWFPPGSGGEGRPQSIV